MRAPPYLCPAFPCQVIDLHVYFRTPSILALPPHQHDRSYQTSDAPRPVIHLLHPIKSPFTVHRRLRNSFDATNSLPRLLRPREWPSLHHRSTQQNPRRRRRLFVLHGNCRRSINTYCNLFLYPSPRRDRLGLLVSSSVATKLRDAATLRSSKNIRWQSVPIIDNTWFGTCLFSRRYSINIGEGASIVPSMASFACFTSRGVE